MLEAMIFLQSFSQVGSFGNFLNQLDQLGFFTYAIPFLIIFAIVFGVLQRTNLFDNKGINGVIALSVGLMALQFGFVSRFFSDIFPKLGAGLAVILIAIILLGLFFDSINTGMMFGIGLVIFVVIVWTSFDFGSSSFTFWLAQNWISLLLVVGFIVLLGWIVGVNPNIPSRKGDSILDKAMKAIQK